MNIENNYQETDLGNVSPNPRGEYDSSTEYEYLDLVSYEGGSYLCLAELGTRITGIAPAQGKNTEYWQLVTLPGDLTPEYIAMHDDVVNRAKQAEASRAAAELAQQATEAAQADVQQLHTDAVKAAQEAENSRDTAGGYASAAEQSRKAAKESEDNVNAQVSGFDTHVTESVIQAQKDITKTRQQAVNTVVSQQNMSVQEVKNQTSQYIRDQETAAEKKITEHTDLEIQRQNTATKEMASTLKKTIENATVQNTALRKTISDASDLSTEIGQQLSDVTQATKNANTATASANQAATSANAAASAANEATETLKTQTNHITFRVGDDGGLDVVYTE